MLDILGVLGALILGLLAGSAVATVAARLPLGARLWGPPLCVRRGVRLPWADALPIVGYLRRGGRCRVCGERLPRWWPLTEATLALGALLAYLAAGGWNVVFALYVADLAVLLLILLMDWRRHEIYTVVLLTGGVLGILGGFVPALEMPLGTVGLGAAVGGGFMLVLYGVGRLLGRLRYGGREALAWGDVELAVMLGLMGGFAGIISTLFWGPIVGVALFIRRGLGTYFPFAPGLCLVMAVYLLTHTSHASLWDVLHLPLLVSILNLAGSIVGKLVAHLF